jgi:hypothetical protein
VPSHPVILSIVNLWVYEREETKMAQHYADRPIDGAVELLKTNGFDTHKLIRSIQPAWGNASCTASAWL